MKSKLLYHIAAIAVLVLLMSERPLNHTAKKGTVKITFKNMVKADPLTLNDVTYTNPFGEAYTVSKFKYYISQVGVKNSTVTVNEENSFHLIDESKPESMSFSFDAPVGKYTTLNFMIGVDSLHNVSGAQTGALDPKNDMFWTWNSGYIMFKFEGNSPVSAQVNNKVEYHIGGYAGSNKVLKMISTKLPGDGMLDIKEGKVSELVIEADIDKWWQGPNDIKIETNAVSMTPGPLAKKFADNYVKIFSVKQVVNKQY